MSGTCLRTSTRRSVRALNERDGRSAPRRLRSCAWRCPPACTRTNLSRRFARLGSAGRGLLSDRRRRRSSGATETRISTLAVLDASAVVRGLRYDDPAAQEWLERAIARTVRAMAPDFVYLEVANALV